MAWTPQTDEDEKDSGPQLTDAQWKQMLETPNAPGFKQPIADPEANAAHPVVRAVNAVAPVAPDVNSSAAPSLPTVGGGIPALAKPTTAESHAAGKEEYQTGLPQVTAKPFTPEWAQQQEQELEYKKAHPLGSDVSAKPGFWGKLEHGLGRVANIAGDIVAPGIAMNVPGSDLYNRGEEKKFGKEYTTGLTNQAEEEGNQLVPWTNPATGETQEVERRQWAPLGAAEVKGDTARDVAGIKADASKYGVDAHTVTALRSQGLMIDPQNPQGPPVAIPDAQLSPKELQSRDLNKALTNYHEAQAAVEAAKNDPHSFTGQLAIQRLQQAKNELQEKYASLGVQEQKIAAEGERTDKGALKTFNSDYVKPANAVEKSYEMMDNAYKEYQAAKAQGKELPTGAQSMVALSTHLSTTFGNVKGARITKDMIEHHLGARGVSDEALVAIQRLTNGDVLSPDQWTAFHGLIKQSRDISWHQAAKEADRAGLPLDFLPEDLKPIYGEGVAYTPTQAAPKGPKAAAGNGAPPAGANIVPLDQFLKTP